MRKFRHQLELIAVKAMFAILRWLPKIWSMRLCGFLMQVAGRFLKRGKRAQSLMQECFPKMTPKEVERNIQLLWRNLGWMLGELPHLKKTHKNPRKLLRQFWMTGNNLPKGGEATYILTAHYGDWEILPTLYGLLQNKYGLVQDKPAWLNVLYFPPTNPLMNIFFQNMRNHAHIRTIPIRHRVTIASTRALLRKEAVGSLFDQRVKRRSNSILIRFLGKELYIDTHTLGIVVRNKTPLFLFRARFDGGPGKHKVEVFGPYFFDDAKVAIRYCNCLLEQWIKEDPGQWFFIHNRWNRW